MQAVADVISAANADLTAIAITARTSGELKPAACKGAAVTLRDRVATIIALAQAMADAIFATNADLTAIMTAAITSGELIPAECKGPTMIGNDQPRHEGEQ